MIQRSTFAALVTLALIAGLFCGPAIVHAQSQGLINTLAQIQQLSDSDLAALEVWAQYGMAVPGPTSSFGSARRAILSLNDSDRKAVLLWLRGSGRSALYALGASDAQIGPPRDRNDTVAPSSSPTPGTP